MNPPAPDPVIDEIREVRHRISAGCDHDPARLVAFLMQYQQQFKDRLIYDPSEQAPSRHAVHPEADEAAAVRPAAPVPGA